MNVLGPKLNVLPDPPNPLNLPLFPDRVVGKDEIVVGVPLPPNKPREKNPGSGPPGASLPLNLYCAISDIPNPVPPFVLLRVLMESIPDPMVPAMAPT